MNRKVYFISGHRNITDGQFIYYRKRMVEILIEIHKNPNNLPRFVVGDYHGVDTMMQELLYSLKRTNPIDLIVYHMFEKPRNNIGNWPTIGGFKTDEERDAAMTAISDEDIAWVNPAFLHSGTEQNIMRRKKMKKQGMLNLNKEDREEILAFALKESDNFLSGEK